MIFIFMFNLAKCQPRTATQIIKSMLGFHSIIICCEEEIARLGGLEIEKYSVLQPLPDRYLTDLGTDPCQEFLTMTLKSRKAFLC